MEQNIFFALLWEVIIAIMNSKLQLVIQSLKRTPQKWIWRKKSKERKMKGKL